MHAVEPTERQLVLNRAAPEAQRPQLPLSDHAMLPLGRCRDRLLT
jgi:hypothetical protein